MAGLLPLLFLSATAAAQADREGSWEMGGTLYDLSSVDLRGAGGSSLHVDSDTGWGFTGAYNFNNRISVGLDMVWSSPDYRATLIPDPPGPPQTIDHELSVDIIHFKGTFNILDNDITPYVEIGGGWTYLDSNVVSGVSGPICWWDYWWGYVCTNYVDTYSDTRTSWAYGLGVRWDMSNDLVLKAAWGEYDIDRPRGEDIKLDSIQLTVAWKF